MLPDKVLPHSNDTGNHRPQNISAEAAELICEDPAIMVISYYICNKIRDSVTELKHLISHSKPELGIVFDKVMAGMAKTNLIRIFGDKIVVLKKAYPVMEKSSNFSFLSKLAATVVESIVRNRGKVEGDYYEERINWSTFPDHPQIRKKLFEIEKNYLVQLEQLEKWVENHPELTADKVRMAMSINGRIEPEDF